MYSLHFNTTVTFISTSLKEKKTWDSMTQRLNFIWFHSKQQNSKRIAKKTQTWVF